MGLRHCLSSLTALACLDASLHPAHYYDATIVEHIPIREPILQKGNLLGKRDCDQQLHDQSPIACWSTSSPAVRRRTPRHVNDILITADYRLLSRGRRNPSIRSNDVKPRDKARPRTATAPCPLLKLDLGVPPTSNSSEVRSKVVAGIL